VIFGAAPGHGFSYRAFSNPPSENLLRIAMMVGMKHNKAGAISFVLFFFFWLSSVNNKIRARVCVQADNSPLHISISSSWRSSFDKLI